MRHAKACWSWPDLQTASQIVSEALAVGNEIGDAVHLAVHQPVPLLRLTDHGSSKATEDDLLKTFTEASHLNEPLLVFVTGDRGSGKSHMVRWLRSAVGPHADWHTVYIKKRNTSLTGVIERVIEGLESPTVNRVREALKESAAESQSVEKAAFQLVNELGVLIEFDEATTVRVRTASHEELELTGQVLQQTRKTARVLLGDLTLSGFLRRKEGPMQRIANLAMPRQSAADDDFDDTDLRLSDSDLVVDLGLLDELGHDAQDALRALGNDRVRGSVALLLNHYLPLAKARVFAGRSTDLLELFADVRREIKSRGRELCLFVEDLVVLHGIDHELAQALTVPADDELCRVRAAVAVTSGYLRNVDTFQDRGYRFSMDVAAMDLEPDARRSFVARYLNVSRVGISALVDGGVGGSRPVVPSGCTNCQVRSQCHDAFGASAEGHGFFPFSQRALDRVIALAAPENFRPREILREVVRGCVQVAEEELSTPGVFPSRRFAASLDQHRRNVPPAVQEQIEQQECSLRNFYAVQPPRRDEELDRVAQFLGVRLSELDVDTGEMPPDPIDPGDRVDPPDHRPQRSVFDDWYLNNKRVPAQQANDVRRWLFGQLHRCLENGATGHRVSKGNAELRVGPVSIRQTSIVIENAAGGGGQIAEPLLEFKPTAANAVLLEGIRGASVGTPNAAKADWYFTAMSIVRQLERRVVALADEARNNSAVEPHLKVLSLTSRLALPAEKDDGLGVEMLFAHPHGGGSPARTQFINRVRPLRGSAYDELRKHFAHAQGSGAPCLLDVGALMPMLVRLREFRRVESDSASGPLAAVQEYHRDFARAIWQPVLEAYDLIVGTLNPTDSLGETMTEMRELVATAQAHGRLPHQDSKAKFDEACEGVRVDAVLPLVRAIAGTRDAIDHEADVWDLPHDAATLLHGLRHFVVVAAGILDHLEDVEHKEATSPEGASREALAESFTQLAEILDRMARA